MIFLNNFSKDQIGEIFSNVLSDTITTTTGLSLEIIDEDESFDELIGLITLNGNNHGMIIVSASYDTIRTLSAEMTGTLRNEVTLNDIYDTLCELVNITAGNAKLRFNIAEDIYVLSPPFIIHGKEMSIITKNRIDFISRTLKGDDLTIKLKVIFY